MNTLLAIGALILLTGNKSSSSAPAPRQPEPTPTPGGGSDVGAAFGAFVGALIKKYADD